MRVRFLADSNVGRLARWLRALGYDAAYETDAEDGALVRRALAEGRILLTRDLDLTQRRVIAGGQLKTVLLKHDRVQDQLRQVASELGLESYRSLRREQDGKEAARKGITLAERELAQHPEDPRPAHLGIAALLELGEQERAREWISRALAIDPDDPRTQYNVACGYTKLGETDAAFDLLERFLPRVGPELHQWIKHDSDLDLLRNHPRYQKILEIIEPG